LHIGWLGNNITRVVTSLRLYDVAVPRSDKKTFESGFQFAMARFLLYLARRSNAPESTKAEWEKKVCRNEYCSPFYGRQSAEKHSNLAWI